jgi:pyruvate dehydrogenase E1 component alpha subunit
MSDAERVIVPDLGVTGSEVRLVEWLADESDYVEAGSPLFSVETDKATVSVEAFRSGRLHRLVPTGAMVAIGSTVAMLVDAPESIPAVPDRPARVAPPPRPARRPMAEGPEFVPPDPGAITAEVLTGWYRRMSLIRRYEDHLHRLFLRGQVPGTLHQCQGQEAVAVGVCAALRRDDVIFSTHRPVGHLLAKGASIEAITAEIWGKATGCAGGKGGQMHLLDLDVGAYPTNAIVGANIPIAAGAAIGFRLRGLDRVAVSFFGDGASNIGTFHEGINLAAVRRAPVVFACENNLYAASTHVSMTTGVEDIAARAAGYGIPGVVVDGMDVVASFRAAAEAVARARAGAGPTLIEYKTYRYPGHSRGDPGQYRSQEEVASWKGRDPLVLCRARLTAEFGSTEERLDAIDRQCQEVVEAAVAFALASPDPDPGEMYGPVFAGGSHAP